MKKQCLKCKSINTKKNWKRQGKQRFLCKSCNYVWEHWGSNNNKNIDFDILFIEYIRDDLKFRQMLPTLNISRKKIQEWFKNLPLKKTIMIK